jgi:1-acyl-sn-glycerol-3-phosphate acyltransferase
MQIAAEIPRWGNSFSRWVGITVLRLFGWKLDVVLPNQPKMVVIAAPHTSNWDFVFGLAAILALQIRLHWFGKHTIFREPFRGLLIKLGGIPIDRTASVGVVEQTTQQFQQKAQLLIGLAPEGTRSLAPKWKSGFYQIANAAQVPILVAYLDYKRKVIGLGPLIQPSDDYAADLKKIQDFYRSVTPRKPENFSAQG